MTVTCRVCAQGAARPFRRVDGRDYWRCPDCLATFLDAAQLPDAAAELHQYRQHRNDPHDPAYRRFLSRLADPLLARLPPAREGLDYGCGPGPALAGMLTLAGHATELHDPFFCPNPAALERTYDFITCTEVAEHFHAPAREFDRLANLLRPGGVLAIMTCFQTDDDRFADWHYRRDPTHVVFYREATFHFLASQRNWRCEIPAKDVALLHTPTP